MVAGPGIQSRGRVDEPVSLLDLHATILDFAKLDSGDVDSRSLRSYLEGETDNHRDVVRSSLGPWQVISDGRYDLVLGYEPDRYDSEWNWFYEFLQDHDSDDQRRATREQRQAESSPLLFDLDSPEDRTDIADNHPDNVERFTLIT